MNSNKICFYIFFLLVITLLACGQSVEEKRRLSREEKQRLAREDSLALKVGTLPTLDCLPLFIAKECRIFDTLGVDVHLKAYTSQIDCDQAMKDGKTEGCVTDLVRAGRMRSQGIPLRYVTATNAYWQLVTNRLARIHELKYLEDKMIAMTRFSATDMLRSIAVDSVRLKDEYVFPVQVNDVHVRLHMLLNNEMDAMLLTEPQATTARLFRHPVLMDSRDKNLHLGVVVFREKALRDKRRQQQLNKFVKAYNAACDSINIKGVQKYGDVIRKYMKCDEKTVQALPKISFPHVSPPRQSDIDRASKWLSK